MAMSLPASTSNLAKRLVLTLPDDGSKVSITTSPGDTVVLDFDLAMAVFDRADDNLEIKMDNGAVILLSGFFGNGEEQIPNFEVRGGALIAGADFLQAVSPEIDLSPAEEGEQPSQQQQQQIFANKGSGVGEYREETAPLVSKVESIPVYQESVNTFHWTNAIVESGPVVVSAETKPSEPSEPSPVVRDLNVAVPFRGAVVAESGLPEGTTPGQGATSGWQTFSLPEGARPVGLESGGTLTIAGDHGEFSIRHLEGDVYEYNYTLTSGIANPQDGSDGAIPDADAISLQISDGFNAGTIQLMADVMDDAPELGLAEGEGPGWAKAALYSGYDIQGEYNVNFGADGEKEDGAVQLKISDGSGSVTLDVILDSSMDVTVGGTRYGTIEFKSDGTYLFKPVSNLTASLTFSIGATDGDGDFAGSGEIVFDITPPVVDLKPLGSHADEWFSEQNLFPGGTAADSSQLTKNILLPDGFKVDLDADGWVAQGWQESWGGREVKGYVYTKVNPDANANNGTLTCIVTETGQRLTYTLESSATHSQQGVDRSDIAYGSVGSITLKDSGGNTYPVDTTFVIYDDQPDVRMFGSGTAQSGMPYSGTWSAVFGADGAAEEGALSISISILDRQSGQTLQVSGALTKGVPFSIEDGNGNSLGTLTLLDGGRFGFVPAPNLEADFTFTLSAKDADGDKVSTGGDFTVKVSKEAPTDLPVHLGDIVFDEANIVAGGKNPFEGTSPDADALTMPIEVPGGYTVNTSGWTQIGEGVWTREGEFGFLTYDTTGEQPVLTYTLESAPQTAGDGKNITYDSLPIKLQDSGGNTFDVPVKIGIADDVPLVSTEGRDGSAAVVESGETFVDGVWSVHFGADGPAENDCLILKVTLVGGAEVCLRQVSPGNGPVEISFDGTVYGQLTLNSDGTYSFKANPNISGQLNFSLIAGDADGDIVNSGNFSLTITSPGGPDIPYLGYDRVFYESSFENGTAPNGALLTQELSIPSGFRIDVTAEGWILQEDGSYLQRGAKGYFICSADGMSLKYTLTGKVENNGNDPIEHDSSRGYDVLTGVRLLNDNGNEYFINAQITITDDAPVLHFGNGEIYEVESGKEFTSGAGEYQLKFGADGSASQGEQPLMLSVSLNGKPTELLTISHGGTSDITVGGVQYGTLTLNDDGTFSFVAAPNIGDKDPARLQFGLIARDSDGDVSSTRDEPVTIIISKPSSLPEGFVLGEGLEVAEAHLPGGTAADEAGLTKILELPAGFIPDLSGWTVGDDGIFTLSGPDNYGTLAWDGKTLSYILEKAAVHGIPGSASDALLQDVFSGVKLKDTYGNTYEVQAEIGIADDTPEVHFGNGDTYKVESGKELISGQGDFLLSFGADGAAGESPLMLSVSINGIPADVMTLSQGEAFDIIIGGVVYGALTLNDNGTFSFRAAPNLTWDGPVQLELGLIATDSEGDVTGSGEKSVIIMITKPSGMPEGFVLGKGVEVSEAHLPGGSAEGEGQVSKVLDLPEGLKPCLEGWSESGDGIFTLTGTGKYGTLSWDGSKLTYTLEKAASHGEPGSDTDALLQDVFSGIRLEDAYGNIYEVQAEIGVTDDAPEVYLSNGENYTVESGAEIVSEDGYRISYGADGAALDAEQALSLIVSLDGEIAESFAIAPGKSVAVSLGDTHYGTLTLNPDGSFTFKAAPNLVQDNPIHLGFALAAMDADGDVFSSGEAPVTIVITKPSGLPDDFVLGKGVDIDEAHLPGGTAAGEGALSKEVPLPEGYRLDTSDWELAENGNYLLAGRYGTLTWDGDRLTYTLEKAASHGEPGSETDILSQDVFTGIRLEDAYGNIYEVQTEIGVMDDSPEVYLSNGESYTVESGTEIVSEEGYRISYGADGAAFDADQALSLILTLDGETAGTFAIAPGKSVAVSVGEIHYGTMTLNPDGTFTFKAASDLVQDDPISLGFALAATDADGDIAGSGDTPVTIAITKSSGLPDDFVLGKGVEIDEAHLPGGTAAGEGAVSKELPLPEGYTLDPSGWEQAGDGNYVLTGKYGVLSWDDGKLTYTLHEAAAHGAPGTDTDVTVGDVFSDVVLLDSKGNSHTVTTEVSIIDDAPQLNVTEGGDTGLGDDTHLGFSTQGTISLDFGADGDTGGEDFTVSLAFLYNGQDGTEDGTLSLQVPKDGSSVSFETALGKGSLYYDADDGTLRYEYEALKGQRNDTEQLTFSINDADLDKAEASVTLTLHEDVSGLVMELDEAGLSFGSASAGHGPAADSGILAEAMVAPGTVQIVWDLDSIPEAKADGNQDGIYDSIVWAQEGNSLYGYADGEIAIKIEPEFADGVFTGGLSVDMYKAFAHGPEGDLAGKLELMLGFDQVNDVGKTSHGTITLHIKDDMPFGNTPEGNGKEPEEITVQEGWQVRKDVFLVVDVSGSIDADAMKQQIEAIRFLAETYEDNGIDAIFTLIPFGSSAELRLDGVDAETLLARLTADEDGSEYLRGTIFGGTNYTAGLDTARESLIASASEPERSYRDKTVFFLSDGEDMEDNGRFMDTWVPYYQANPDIDIYALGVGGVFDAEDRQNLDNLINVTGKEANVVQVDDFAHLHDALAGLVTPEHGNFFKEPPSADVTFVSEISVWYGDEPRSYAMQDTGDISGMKNTGSIDIGNGIIMVVYENGDYKIMSKNISEDYSTTITLSLVDADGDTYTTGPIAFTVEDHKPWALDKTATYAPGYGEASLFGSFGSAAISQSEGWHSHHAAWNTWLPEGMEPCPSDPDLDPFTDHASMQLTAAPLIVNYAQEHLDGNPLTEILSELEIPTNLQYVSDLFGYQAAFASKSFNTEGGEIVFNWSFEGCGSEGEKDAAFWVLLDDSGVIVDSGRIAMAEDSGDSLYMASGVTRVPVPDSDSAKDYKLVIGCVNGGDTNSSDASLVLGSAALLEGHYDFAGNVYIREWSPPHDNMRLGSLAYNGETYTFAEGQDVLVIEMETGIFTANYMGDYTFAAYSDELSEITEKVRYTMVDQDGDRGAATLTISGDSTRGFQVEHEYPEVPVKSDLGTDIPGEALSELDDGHASSGTPQDEAESVEQTAVRIVGCEGNGSELIRGGSGDDVIHGGHGNDSIYAGGGNNTLWGGSGADLFVWTDESDLIGKDIIMDFSTGEGDRFSFTELLSAEQSMEDFFRQNVSSLSLDAEKNAIAFDIVKDSHHKEGEVYFEPGMDSAYSSTKSEYLNAADEAAQNDVLYQFLSNISQ